MTFSHKMNFYMLTIACISRHLLIADAHSYVVESRRVSLGSFVGEPGYTRGYGTYIKLLQFPRSRTLIALQWTLPFQATIQR